MGEQLEGQKLRHTAFAKDQNDWLLVVDDASQTKENMLSVTGYHGDSIEYRDLPTNRFSHGRKTAGNNSN